MRNRVLAILGAAAVLASPALAGNDREKMIPEAERPALEAEIRALFDQQGQGSEYPLPQLEAEDMEKLLKGELIRLRSKWTLDAGVDPETGEAEERERHRVMAYQIFPKPRETVWIAALDPHFLGNDRLSEARLETDGASSVWYQLIDPPWPAKNRHWVIDVSRPKAVPQATNGRAWELMWKLTEGGEAIAMEVTAAGRVKDVPLDRAKKSRYLEENLGAWTMFELSDELTLVAYQVTIVMGGWIPDRLTARFAKGALEDLMKSVDAATEKVAEHYDDEHEPIWSGDWKPLPPMSRQADAAAATADRE